MEQISFLGIIKEQIKDHPDWFGDMVKVATQSIRDRLDQEMNRNTKHDFALLMAYDAGKINLKKKPKNLKSVLVALSNLDSFKDTPYQNKIRKELEELEVVFKK